MKALQGEICPATAILWSAVSPIKNPFIRTSLVVQCLRLCAPNAGDAGSIPGQGTRSHKPQLRASQAQPNKIFKEKKTKPHSFNSWRRPEGQLGFGCCVSPLSWCVLSRFSRVRLSATPWIVACQAPLSMEFSRQEYWSGLPCPPPGDLPDPGIKPASLPST